MLALLLVPAALADPGWRPDSTADLHHAAPEEPPDVGDWQAVAVPGLRPCAEPEGDCTGAPLALGDSLVVAAVGPSRDGVHRDRWLQIRAAARVGPDDLYQAQGPPLGWVTGRSLTRAAFEADLDGDGAPEVLTVRFADDVTIEAWVAAPGAARAPEQAQRLDLGQRSDIDGPQDHATATLMPASKAGIPLVAVRWHAREQCGSGDWTAYVSHRSADGRPAAPRLALDHMGSGGDAPIWWETTVAFDAAKGTATVHHRAGEHDDDGGESVHHDKKTTWVRAGGVYLERAE